MKQLTKNFNLSEFTCRCGCGLGNISIGLVDLLQKVRTDGKHRLIILSGCRCINHNKSVRGKPNSSHLKGYAVDILCTDVEFRYNLIFNLINMGITRIGIADSFIHADIDYNKRHPVIWVY